MSLETPKLLETLKKVRENSKQRKFSQTIDMTINLQEIDMKKPESKIQESIELPHPLTKKAKICVIATGELAMKAKQAGVDLVIEKDELNNIATDKKRQRELANTYDFFICEAPLMPTVGKSLGAVLGPRGKMPTPVPPNADIKAQIARHQRLAIVRTKTQALINARVGTEDMKDEQIAENITTIIRRLEGKLKRGIKNIKSITLKTTMGKPVEIKL
ncbi:MAG TPA: 50S ribosomal protein L1 [Candidatus Krumholzibacteriaceae bacterium]|nr:50S ribosomal protein L1 [Candidatus Krumholzibacteriaceae bacterium]